MWQVDRCPPWCIGGHGERDHPDDRVHRSLGVTVPAVVRRPILTPTSLDFDVASAEIEVGLARLDGDTHTWVYIGSGPGESIEISAESAAELVRVLSNELARL